MQGFKKFVKTLLKDSNESEYTYWEDRWLSNHDVAHMELTMLPPIIIAGSWVTGIGGVCIPEFKTQGNIPLYIDLLDECRVAFYQVIKRPTLCGFFRALYWAAWLIKKKENPLWVLYQQYKSMR